MASPDATRPTWEFSARALRSDGSAVCSVHWGEGRGLYSAPGQAWSYRKELAHPAASRRRWSHAFLVAGIAGGLSGAKAAQPSRQTRGAGGPSNGPKDGRGPPLDSGCVETADRGKIEARRVRGRHEVGVAVASTAAPEVVTWSTSRDRHDHDACRPPATRCTGRVRNPRTQEVHGGAAARPGRVV